MNLKKPEPAIIWKLVTSQRITSKRYSTSMGQHLSPPYGQVILVSGYPVLTAVNWSQLWCAIWRAVYCHVITKFSGIGRFTYPWLILVFKAIHGALSIQQKSRFKISEIARAQWNGTFRLHRPDPSPCAFGYCSCKPGYERAVLRTTILSNGKGHFGPTDRND